MSRNATVNDCLEILRDHPQELSRLLPLQDVQLSFPTGDHNRACIKVSVRPGEKRLVPDRVRFRIRGEEVSVSLKVEEDFQDYRLH